MFCIFTAIIILTKVLWICFVFAHIFVSRSHYMYITPGALANIFPITYMLIVVAVMFLFIYFIFSFALLSFLLIFGQMSLHMQCEMIGTRKTALADNAFERFGASVFAIVTRQFVGARKTPFTLRPLAGIGLLAGVYTLVRFQM